MSEKLPTLRTVAGTSDALEGRNLGLFIDGRRVEAKGFYERDEENVYHITFSVPHGLVTGAFESSASAELWGGWRVGDMAWVYPLLPGEKEPTSGKMGMARIADIIPPKSATSSSAVKVVVEALMPIYDGLSSEPVIRQNDTGTIPLTWLKQMESVPYGH
jgi:hypothetical protein